MEMKRNENSLWVFAYASLLWKPGFHYHQQVVGHIKGFKRRFFQGNTNLRGCPQNPGRVAILVPDPEEVTWGVAYEIRGKQHVQQAVEHLFVRENAKGGYDTFLTPFHPRHRPHPPATSDGDDDDDSSDDSEREGDVTAMTSEPFQVVSFTATPESQYYMGPADLGVMARQVVAAHGKAGPNTEYVLKTAEYIRRHIPEDRDSHLFELEREVRDVMASVQRQAGLHHHHHQHPVAVHH